MNKFRLFKKLAVAAGLLAFCGMPALVNAQDTPQSNTQDSMQGQAQSVPMHHGPRQDDELAKLNLSDDQKSQVQKIRQDAKTQMDAVNSDTTLTADQKQAKLKEIHKSSHQQVIQLLTPDQRKQMKADEMARKAAKQQNGQAPPPQQ